MLLDETTRIKKQLKTSFREYIDLQWKVGLGRVVCFRYRRYGWMALTQMLSDESDSAPSDDENDADYLDQYMIEDASECLFPIQSHPVPPLQEYLWIDFGNNVTTPRLHPK